MNDFIEKQVGDFKITIDGNWCEVIDDNGKYVYDGNVADRITPEDVYKILKARVVFEINCKQVASYDLWNEFPGERDSTIELLAFENGVSKDQVIVSVDTPWIPR